jgi:hypothetical protein
MARPEKNTVDYFPHPSRHGKKMAYIRKKYGNDGYATWFIILEQLGSSDRHYLDLSSEIGVMYLETDCCVDQEKLFSIIEDLVKLGEFDQELWRERKILFNQKFVDSIHDAYSKRSSLPPTKHEILRRFGVSVPENDENSSDNSINGVKKPQIKEKEIKENKTKGGVGEKSEKDFSPSEKNENPMNSHPDTKNDLPPPKDLGNKNKSPKVPTIQKQLEMMEKVILPHNTPEFRQAWENWLRYKVEIRKTYKTEKTMQAALKKFADYPPTRGIKAIEDSISNQWTGVFPENPKYNATNQHKNQPATFDQRTFARVYEKLVAHRQPGISNPNSPDGTIHYP